MSGGSRSSPSSPLATRSSRPAVRCGRPRFTTPTPRCWPTRCASSEVSKGAGDVSYRVVAELDDPGIVAHGVALKPGKPICLAATGGRPVVVLPGFPTSAIFTFHEFVAPVISAMAGRSLDARAAVQARLAVRVNSEIGRTEYLLVGLVDTQDSAL